MSRLGFIESKKVKIHKEKKPEELIVETSTHFGLYNPEVYNLLYFTCSCGHKMSLASTNTDTLNVSFTFDRKPPKPIKKTESDLNIIDMCMPPTIKLECGGCHKEFCFGYEKGQGTKEREATKRVYE